MNRRGFLASLFSLPFVPILKIQDPNLMWYKAKQAVDSGLFYCPYIPLQYYNSKETKGNDVDE